MSWTNRPADINIFKIKPSPSLSPSLSDPRGAWPAACCCLLIGSSPSPVGGACGATWRLLVCRCVCVCRSVWSAQSDPSCGADSAPDTEALSQPGASSSSSPSSSSARRRKIRYIFLFFTSTSADATLFFIFLFYQNIAAGGEVVFSSSRLCVKVSWWGRGAAVWSNHQLGL